MSINSPKKEAGKQIKNIKNKVINPYRDAVENSKSSAMSRQTAAEKAEKGHKAALDLEKKAAAAGVTLDKAAMRRLDKIKDRFEQANQKSGFKQGQSEHAHKTNKAQHEAFVTGQTAAAKKAKASRGPMF